MITIPRGYVLGKEVLDLAGMHRTNMYKWDLEYLVYGNSKFYKREALKTIKKLAPYVDKAYDYEQHQCSTHLADLFSTSRATIHTMAKSLDWPGRVAQHKTFYRIDDQTMLFFNKHRHRVVPWLYNSNLERTDFTEVLTIDVGHNKPIRFGAWI